MKRSRLFLAGLLATSMLFAGCGSNNQASSNNEGSGDSGPIDIVEPESIEVEIDSNGDEILPDGYVRSQLTNEPILEEKANIRPIAVMVPNDSTALPHYNISNASVVYQCRVEGSISRLMMVLEDWEDMERIGNIRSAREYYVYWAAEWDPILLHFGNPFYADEILASEHIDRINGTTASGGIFYRSSDRSAPQNAYTSTDGIEVGLSTYSISKTHTNRYQEGHFTFAENGGQTDLTGMNGCFDCTKLDMGNCYPVDKTYFEYDEEHNVYLRYEFGKEHVDAANNCQVSFSNIIIQNCKWNVLDEKGYLWFNTVDKGSGYYLTNGKCIPITWSKADVEAPTKYFDVDGNEIVFSTGKTMICINEDGNCEPIFE